jgi:hypothetical protein
MNEYRTQQAQDVTFTPKINERSDFISGKYERTNDALYLDAVRR